MDTHSIIKTSIFILKDELNILKSGKISNTGGLGDDFLLSDYLEKNLDFS